MTVTVHPLSPALGVEIRGIDLNHDIDDDTFAHIVDAWHAHLVICFPGQGLDTEAQARLCRRFGRIVPGVSRSFSHSGDGDDGAGAHPDAMLVSNIKQDGEWIGTLPVGALSFHSDGAFRPVPVKASMLYAIEVPKVGGETVFTNMYAVFDALDAKTHALLEDCTADNYFLQDEHTKMDPKRVAAQSTDGELHHVHPAVITHPATGRKALFVSPRMTRRLMELDEEVYRPVLDRIFEMVEAPEFTYAHDWTPGDLVIWDNRCTLHGRRDFDPAERRMLRRFTIEGDAPPRHLVAPGERVSI